MRRARIRSVLLLARSAPAVAAPLPHRVAGHARSASPSLPTPSWPREQEGTCTSSLRSNPCARQAAAPSTSACLRRGLCFGGIQIATESYDARGSMLWATPPRCGHGEVRYRFDQRREVTNDLLFQGVSADIRVEGRDDTGLRPRPERASRSPIVVERRPPRDPSPPPRRLREESSASFRSAAAGAAAFVRAAGSC